MSYDFTTLRLVVREWHSFKPQEILNKTLADVVQEILISEITIDFPIMWRGNYNKKRSLAWIDERDLESTTLLAVEKSSNQVVGFINFFKVLQQNRGVSLRLGYTLKKNMWNKGFATELLEGFLQTCKNKGVHTLIASVDPKNSASISVLEKNNFLQTTLDSNGKNLLFEYKFYHYSQVENSPQERERHSS